jgi:hypothetical protein
MAWTATALASVACPFQASIPEPRLDALAEPLFQEAQHVVNTNRRGWGSVSARQQEPRFALGEPPVGSIATDRAVRDRQAATATTGSEKLSHQSKTHPRRTPW